MPETPVRLTVNGEQREISVDPETPLLTALRDQLGLSGPKEGCSAEQCYACAVLVDGRAQPSCQLPVGRVGDGLDVTTVEGIDGWEDFFVAEQAGQCGYCLSGMIVSAESLLRTVRYPNDAQIREMLDTNLCRCGVYDRIRRAIKFRIGQPEPGPPWEVRTQEPMEQPRLTPSPSIVANPELDHWLTFEPDATVSVRSGKVELGQGIATALAQIAATELSVATDRIRMTPTDTAVSPNEGLTAGSMSIEHSGGAIRLAAATARRHLLAAGAQRLGVNPADLSIEDGTIIDPGSGASVTYWELPEARRFERSLIGEDPVSFEAPAPATLETGADTDQLPRLDLPAKLTGQPTYVHDLRPTDGRSGRVIRPPGPGASLVSVDAGAVDSLPGDVRVVRDGSFLAVVADGYHEALVAADVLAAAATWKAGPRLADGLDHLMRSPTADYFVVDGSPVDHEIEPLGQPTVSARYTKPLTMHASMGPSAAVAFYENADHDGRLTVWSSTQGPFVLRDAIAEALSMSPTDVRVVHVEGAGCYGHNGADDAAFDAALLAMNEPGRPVSVNWSRADEHRWEPYSPAMAIQLGAVLADDGTITGFDLENWSTTHTNRPRASGDDASGLLAAWYRAQPRPAPPTTIGRQRHIGAHRNSDPLYAIENRRLQTHLVTDTPIRTSATRALGAFANVFAIESFMDELAHHAGIDPVEYRLRHLRDQRAAAVIEAAAEAAGWGDEKPDGVGRGIGFARYKNAQTYAAVVVEAAVTTEDEATNGQRGDIVIRRAVIAADSGRIVSADGTSNQLEGGCTQAASWTLRERVRVGASGIESHDWETYPILRFGQSFPIRTVLLDRPDQPSLGAGEAVQGPTAAAIANAVYDATGERHRDLPLLA